MAANIPDTVTDWYPKQPDLPQHFTDVGQCRLQDKISQNTLVPADTYKYGHLEKATVNLYQTVPPTLCHSYKQNFTSEILFICAFVG
jgi:hypothetical protein